MKTKSLIKLAVLLVILVGVVCWSVTDKTIGITKFKAWYTEVQLGMDIEGGVSVVYEVQPATGVDYETGFAKVKSVLEKRLSESNIEGAVVTQQGENRLRLEVPTLTSPDEVLAITGGKGHMELRDADDKVLVNSSNVASAKYENNYQQKVLTITFDEEGKTLYTKATQNNTGKNISLYLDGQQLTSFKVDAKNDSGVLQLTVTSAKEGARIAAILNNGELSLKTKEISATAVSATLGAAVLEKAFIAAAVGIGLALLLLVVVYRARGLAAAISMVIYMLLFYRFLATFPWVQLTLPSIAGVLVSVAFALDANIIVFERMKAEFRQGKSIEASVQSGYQKSLSAIADVSIAIGIVGIVLLLPFSPLPLQSFAVVLLAGVVINLFTSLYVTKWILNLLIKCGFSKPGSLGLALKKNKGGAE